MRKMKMLCLGVLAVFAISGCGMTVTAERLMREASENVAEIESTKMNVGMDMKAEIAVMGVRADVDMKVNLDMLMTKKPLIVYTSGIMSANAFEANETTVLESYVEQDGKDSIIYNKSENGTWEKTTGKSIENTADLFTEKEIESMLDTLELAKETENINQIECYNISGKVEGSVIEESLNELLGGQEGMEMFGDMDLSDVSVPVQYYISTREHRPVKLTMDLKDIIQDVMKKAVQMSMGEEGMNIDMSMDIDKCLMEITYVSFDSIDEIEIPAAAKNATEASLTGNDTDDELSEQDLSDILADNDGEKGEDVTSAAESTGLSILQDTTIKINGQTITFPCSLDDLRAVGIEFDKEYNEQISSQDYGFVYVELGRNSKGSMQFIVYNDTDEAKAAFDCQVGGLSYNCYSDAYKMDLDLEFQQGLKIGDPIEKAAQLYGEPNAKNIYDDYTAYSWENEDNYHNRCGLRSDEDGNIIQYEFTNFDIDW